MPIEISKLEKFGKPASKYGRKTSIEEIEKKLKTKGYTANELAEEIGISEVRLRYYLRELSKQGKLKRVVYKGKVYWYIPPK